MHDALLYSKVSMSGHYVFVGFLAVECDGPPPSFNFMLNPVKFSEMKVLPAPWHDCRSSPSYKATHCDIINGLLKQVAFPTVVSFQVCSNTRTPHGQALELFSKAWPLDMVLAERSPPTQLSGVRTGTYQQSGKMGIF
jgi:hypothetical protein